MQYLAAYVSTTDQIVTSDQSNGYNNGYERKIVLQGKGFPVSYIEQRFGHFFTKIAKELAVLIEMKGNTMGHISSYRFGDC